jgi:hypothetical protein
MREGTPDGDSRMTLASTRGSDGDADAQEPSEPRRKKTRTASRRSYGALGDDDDRCPAAALAVTSLILAATSSMSTAPRG